MKVAVLGAGGYGGQVLTRLLLGHPQVQEILPVSSTKAGEPLGKHFPGLGLDKENKLSGGGRFFQAAQGVSASPDAVFSALPPGISAQVCDPFLAKSVVFDLSADFRLRDPRIHQETYGSPPPRPDLREDAVYGLVETNRKKIRQARLIAVPGCYPTCVLLPLLPLAAAGLVEGPLVVNALSGISGAGKKPREDLLFVERAENAQAYHPGQQHRHVPEILQGLRAAGSQASLFFTPHLVPLRRGMAATMVFPARAALGKGGFERVGELLEEAYGKDPFVQLRGEDIPAVRDAAGSNCCHIGWRLSRDKGGGEPMVYLFSVLDNLLKGAAGQAVQGFNIRFGWEETAGLPLRGGV